MRLRVLGILTLLGGALLLLAPGQSEAQVRVSVGVQRGNVGFYGGNAPYYGGYSPRYGYGYPYGYGDRYGYGYPYGYGRSGISIGISTGGYPYGYGYAPVYANRYYTPYIAGYDPYYYGGSATYLVQPQTTLRPMAPPSDPPMTRVDNTAQIDVRVPAEAKVWFDGQETTQTGSFRRFVTPDLESGYNYKYNIRATWTENGEPVTQERKVAVKAGGKYQVDLTGEALPVPKKVQP